MQTVMQADASAARRNRVMLAGVYALLGIVAAGAVVLLWWSVQPVAITEVRQPIPILNDSKIVMVGEPILHELNIRKAQPLDTSDAVRYVACDSGNLITLTSRPVDLPVGEFVIRVDDLLLPDKVVDRDTCTLEYRVTFRVNPIRNVVGVYSSDRFMVLDGD